MAKMYKVELYLVDYKEEYKNIGEILEDIENRGCIFMQLIKSEGRLFDWDNELKINQPESSTEDFDEYFESLSIDK